MNINRLSELMNFGVGRVQPGESGKISQPFNTKDGFTAASPESSSFSKPVIAKSSPVVEEEKPAANKTTGAALPGFFSAAASFGAISGTTGAALTTANTSAMEKRLQSLADKKIEFFQDRGWTAPLFLGKPKKLTPKEAAGILTSGQQKLKDKLLVKVPDTRPAPLRNDGDVNELEAFHGGGKTGNMRNPRLVGFLKDAETEEITFTTKDGTRINTYEAYNRLSGDWKGPDGKPVKVYAGWGKYPVMELDNEKMKDMKAFGEELKEFHKELTGFAVLGMLGRKNLMETLSTTAPQIPFREKFDILIKLRDAIRRGDGSEAFMSVAEATGSGEDMKSVADHYLAIHEKVTFKEHRDPLWIELPGKALIYAEKNLKGKPKEEEIFLEMVRNTRNVKTSIDAMEVIKKPVGKESYEERLGKIKNFVMAFGDKSLKKYREVRKNLLPGQTFPEGLNEYACAKKEFWHETHEAEFVKRRESISSSPVRSKAYVELVNVCNSPMKAWKMMEEIEKPIEGTAFEDRAKVMNDLAGGFESWKIDHTDSIMEFYQHLAKNLKPGEKFIDVCSKFTTIMKSFKYDIAASCSSKRCFDFIRNEIKEDPRREADFLNMTKAVRDGNYAIDAYRFIQKPLKDESYEARRNVILKLLPHHHFDGIHSIQTDKHSWETEMEKMSEHVYPGETFESVAEQYLAVYEAKGFPEYAKGPYEFFDEFKKKYGADMSRFDKLVEMVKHTYSFEKTEAGVDLLEKPVRDESYQDREAVVQKLSDSFKENFDRDTIYKSGPLAVELYEFITGSITKNETLDQVAQQFIEFKNTHEKSSTFIIVDHMIKDFRDFRARFGSNTGETETFLNILGKFYYKTALEVKEMLETPVRDESFEDREKLLDEMVEFNKKQKSSKYPQNDAIKVFKMISENINGNDTLKDAWNRYKKLYELIEFNMEKRKEEFEPEMVQNIYMQVNDEINKGSLNDLTLNDILSKIISGTILGEGIEDIMGSIKSGMNGENRIVDQKDSITIGGVKLQKRKGSFSDILRSIKTDLGV